MTMNTRIRDENIRVKSVELLDIETLAELEEFKSKLLAQGFWEMHQINSPDGTILLCLGYKGVVVHCDLEEMVGARAKLIDLYGVGTLDEAPDAIISMK